MCTSTEYSIKFGSEDYSTKRTARKKGGSEAERRQDEARWDKWRLGERRVRRGLGGRFLVAWDEKPLHKDAVIGSSEGEGELVVDVLCFNSTTSFLYVNNILFKVKKTLIICCKDRSHADVTCYYCSKLYRFRAAIVV